jgi:hypothetical protein
VQLDPGDFDALGVMTSVVETLARHTAEVGRDTAATVSAPPGRHRLTVTARPGGHVVLAVRYDELTTSRRNATAIALRRAGWDDDADHDGATRRLPPGTSPADAAFEALSVLTLAGTPAAVRTVTAVDATGTPVPL